MLGMEQVDDGDGVVGDSGRGGGIASDERKECAFVLHGCTVQRVAPSGVDDAVTEQGDGSERRVGFGVVDGGRERLARVGKTVVPLESGAILDEAGEDFGVAFTGGE